MSRMERRVAAAERAIEERSRQGRARVLAAQAEAKSARRQFEGKLCFVSERSQLTCTVQIHWPRDLDLPLILCIVRDIFSV